MITSTLGLVCPGLIVWISKIFAQWKAIFSSLKSDKLETYSDYQSHMRESKVASESKDVKL